LKNYGHSTNFGKNQIFIDIYTNIIAGKLGVKKGDKSTIVSDVFLASINSEQGDAGIKT